MFVLLILGYFMMSFYLIIMCTIPCLILYIRYIALQMQRERNPNLIDQS